MIALGCATAAQAGVIELGASASYHKTTITPKNYSTSESYTGSLAYYFTESSAVELSYTEGVSKGVTDTYETNSYFNIYGADLILTVGGKESAFRPYVKVGGAYVYKEIHYKQFGFDVVTVKSGGLVPSAGLGFKLLLTSNFALRAGVEGQSSPAKDDYAPEGEHRDTVYDFAAKGGISWMF